MLFIVFINRVIKCQVSIEKFGISGLVYLAFKFNVLEGF
jgi:hypothetical protein